ncbi:hypothetical protein [Paraburkholderia xenovorans]|nr:hypothetical protein [Paraburkholderia xenovorans]
MAVPRERHDSSSEREAQSFTFGLRETASGQSVRSYTVIATLLSYVRPTVLPELRSALQPSAGSPVRSSTCSSRRQFSIEPVRYDRSFAFSCLLLKELKLVQLQPQTTTTNYHLQNMALLLAKLGQFSNPS